MATRESSRPAARSRLPTAGRFRFEADRLPFAAARRPLACRQRQWRHHQRLGLGGSDGALQGRRRFHRDRRRAAAVTVRRRGDSRQHGAGRWCLQGRGEGDDQPRRCLLRERARTRHPPRGNGTTDRRAKWPGAERDRADLDGRGSSKAMARSSRSSADWSVSRAAGAPALNIVALRKGLEVEAGVAITGTARRPRCDWCPSLRAGSGQAVVDRAGARPTKQRRRPGAAHSSGPGAAWRYRRRHQQPAGGQPGFGSDIGWPGRPQQRQPRRDQLGGRFGHAGERRRLVSGQVVTLGKRLSAEAFISFEQSLVGAASIVKLSYQLSRRVSVVARGGTDNAVDMYYTFVFR